MGRGLFVGALVAAGALMLIPGVAAATARAARPLMRSALKQGAKGAAEVQRSLAEAYEHLEDVAAEVRSEIDAENKADEAAAFSDDLGAAERESDHVPAPRPS
ncbi:MAG: DUF5132 domain-containing protein, partial [Pseudomonadota bacterium]